MATTTTTIYKVTAICDLCGKVVATAQHKEQAIAEGMAKFGENLHASDHTALDVINQWAEATGEIFTPDRVETMKRAYRDSLGK